MAWDKLFSRGASAPATGAGAGAETDSVSSPAGLNAPEMKRETVRRSKRVYISMPVLVQCQRTGQPYEEHTVTETVNAYGCMVRLAITVERGQKLTIVNLKSSETVECSVAFVSQSDGGKTKVGVEFVRPAEYFWHIAFPPDDWDPSDRKRPIVEPPAPRPQKRA